MTRKSMIMKCRYCRKKITNDDNRGWVGKDGFRRCDANNEKAAAWADELETEYGVSFLCDCHRETKKVPATKKTVQQVVTEYSDILDRIYRTRTAGDFTWKGLLHEFMSEIASTEDE